MKKVLFCGALLILFSSNYIYADIIQTYEGQSKLTPCLVGDNIWRLDCTAADKDCCTINWDKGTVMVYGLPPMEGGPEDPDGNYTGNIDAQTFENVGGSITVEIN